MSVSGESTPKILLRKVLEFYLPGTEIVPVIVRPNAERVINPIINTQCEGSLCMNQWFLFCKSDIIYPRWRCIFMDDRYRERYRLLGLKISLYRKLRGFTQEEFAEKIDLSVSFISQIEANNGKRIRGISLNTLFRMAE